MVWQRTCEEQTCLQTTDLCETRVEFVRNGVLSRPRHCLSECSHHLFPASREENSAFVVCKTAIPVAGEEALLNDAGARVRIKCRWSPTLAVADQAVEMDGVKGGGGCRKQFLAQMECVSAEGCVGDRTERVMEVT